ncbi:MAG: hypothetical protein ACK500_10050 [Flavobacteriales bacterium]|jgi:hypothetical protein
MSNALFFRIFFLLTGQMGWAIAHSQNGVSAPLAGTWELRAIEMRGKFSTPDYLQWMVLSGDGALKRSTIAYPETAPKDTLHEIGTWELNGEDLVFRIPGHIPDSDSTWVNELSYKVRSVSDSSLVLSGWSGKMPLHLHYHQMAAEEKPVKKRRCRKPFSSRRK